MPTRAAPPPTAAQELIAALTGVHVATESQEQSAAREFLAELYGVDLPSPSERGEDFFTAHTDRRRPAGMPYNPIPPQPGAFGDFPAEMEWVQCDSSNVDRIAYDAERKYLYVQFLSGAVYRYYDVPPSTWDDFLASNSKGMFVWHVLRNNDRLGSRFQYLNIRTGQWVNSKGQNFVTPRGTIQELVAAGGRW